MNKDVQPDVISKEFQHTVADSVLMVGMGVHSGERCALTILPAEPNTGIRFLRQDTNESVKAHTSNVFDTQLSTSLSANHKAIQVSTVEHLMFAFWATKIDNALVLLSNIEIPVMDGSARSYIDAIQQVGIKESRVPRKWIRITQTTKVTSEDSFALLKPYEGFKVSYTFDHDSPVYSSFPSYLSLDTNRGDDITSELAYARTFGEFKDLALANRIGKCLGSDLTNSVGLDDNGVMNEEGLRSEDEFVRHKLLDAIGDLYLFGMPVVGEFVGYKSGHYLNSLLARTVLENPEHFEIVTDELDSKSQASVA